MDYEVANWKQRRREKPRPIQLLSNQNDLFWDLIGGKLLKRPRMNDMDWNLYVYIFVILIFFLTLRGIAMLTYDLIKTSYPCAS